MDTAKKTAKKSAKKSAKKTADPAKKRTRKAARKPRQSCAIVTKELTFSQWSDLEGLLPDELDGRARRHLKGGLASGEVLGLLLYVGKVPAGYCSFGASLAGLSSSCSDSGVAIPGYRVMEGFERAGRRLLEAALERLARSGLTKAAPLRLPESREESALVSTGTGPAFSPPPRGAKLRLVSR